MMRLTSRSAAQAPWMRLPRRTARLRLTVLYGCLFLAAGAGLLGFTYWLFDTATFNAQFVPLGLAGPALCAPCASARAIPVSRPWRASK